jgi:predicted Rossmann fold nucleotide-binding protein DprA/Smf involved in DNA uptake
MTGAVVVSGSRQVAHRPLTDYDGLFAAYLAPFVSSDSVVFVGGAVGIDSLALVWLVRHTTARLQVVVPATVADQPAEAQEAVAQARAEWSEVVLTELRLPEFPGRAAYHARNRWMVDRAALVVAFPLGNDLASGTNHTIDYAASRGLARMVVPI